VFRRRSTETPNLLDAGQADPDTEAPRVRSNLTPKKAGPTPKRSEAEGSRRGPYTAPADRKAAYQDSRTRDKGERNRKAAAYQRGEQWAMPAKDRGPVRALARDFVDSRHGLSEYYLIAVLPIFILLFLRVSYLQIIADGIVLAILLVVVTEGYYVGSKVERLAKERFPGENTRGVRLYAAMRGTQLRRLRIPKPRVDRGDPV
jgi:hypothetical protein